MILIILMIIPGDVHPLLNMTDQMIDMIINWRLLADGWVFKKQSVKMRVAPMCDHNLIILNEVTGFIK